MVNFPSHLIKLLFILTFNSKSWIVDFFTCFTSEKKNKIKKKFGNNFAVFFLSETSGRKYANQLFNPNCSIENIIG